MEQLSTTHYSVAGIMFLCRVKQETRRLFDKLHIEQGCLLGLIHGSQIDWSADDELCQLVCELGQQITTDVE